MSTEELTANRLLRRAREAEGYTVDDLLGALAHSIHNESEILLNAREAGADIGCINRYAYELKERTESALR